MVVHVARFAPWLALVLVGCATRTEHVALSVRLADDPACRPDSPPSEVRVTALGDFGPVGTTAIVADGASVDRFPFGTRAFRGEVEVPGFRGAAIAIRAERAVLRLQPFDVPCASTLPLDGAGLGAIAETQDGGFAVAGGLEDGGIGVRTVRIVGPGLVDDRRTMPLPTRRVLASAHVIGSRLFVVGGALGDTGPALDAADVIDLRTGALLSSTVMTTPRRDHGAVALADGRVLVVGGRSAHDGPALASGELVGASGPATPTDDLPFARIAPEVVRLDDGAVFVLGGLGAGGSPYSTTSVFAFGASSATFVDRSDEASVRSYARYVAVPLVGGRVAWVGDARPGLSSAELTVLRHVLPDVDVPSVEANALDLRAEMVDLTGTAATSLLDGRLVITGVDATDAPRGYVVDVGRGVVDTIDVLEAPRALHTLTDGSVLAVGETSLVTYRFRAVTPWDSPPETILAEELAFDVAGRWTFPSAVRFTALVSGARFDLPTLRFSSFDARFLVESGEAELWLLGTTGLAASILVREDEVAVGLCTVPRLAGEEIAIARRGDRLTVGTTQGTRTCTVPTLEGDVGIAVRASAGATVRAPRIERR